MLIRVNDGLYITFVGLYGRFGDFYGGLRKFQQVIQISSFDALNFCYDGLYVFILVGLSSNLLVCGE